MKISKLISKAKAIQEKYGDIECDLRDDQGWRVNYTPLTAGHISVSSPKTNPKLTIKRYV